MSSGEELNKDAIAANQSRARAETTSEVPTTGSVVPASSSPLSEPLTWPSSPPVPSAAMGKAKGDMAPPATIPKSTNANRKRSRGQSQSEANETSTATRISVAPHASEGRPDEEYIDSVSQANEQTAVKEQPPSSAAQAQNVQPADESIKRQPKSSQVQPPQSAQRDVGLQNDPQTGDEDDSDPDEQMRAFDWEDLEMRYHGKLQKIATNENQIHHEFATLSQYFQIWAQAGADKEVDRGFKRLKTQMSYVQNEEGELEKKRQHYIKVVDAFQEPGDMLDRPNLAKDIVANPSILHELREIIEKPHRRPPKRRRNLTDALIDAGEWGAHTVEDLDLQIYHCVDTHLSRCTIL